MNCIENQYLDVLPNIAAENAATRAKIKQELDLAHVINDDIKKADLYIKVLKRDNKRYDELYEIKSQQMSRLENELTCLTASRELLQSNSENLKRQYELILIEDDQRQKERNTEIFNLNRLVVRRNNLANQCEAARIHVAVLNEREKEYDKQKRQLREIENLKLKSVSVQLAEVWLRNRREKEKLIMLKNKLAESLEEEKSKQNRSQANETCSPSSQDFNLPMPMSSPIRIPSFSNIEDSDLTKYFLKINSFRKTRSPSLQLPLVLSQSLPPRVKELRIDALNPSKRICLSPEKSETITKDSKLKLVDLPRKDIKSSFKPIQEDLDENEIIIEPPKSYSSPKLRSPVAIEPAKQSEKFGSPLIISRKSPLSISRIPVAVNSPRTPRVPTKYPPGKALAKKDFAEKDRRREVKFQDHMDLDKLNETQAKRLDVNSPKRNIKHFKTDYVAGRNDVEKVDFHSSEKEPSKEKVNSPVKSKQTPHVKLLQKEDLFYDKIPDGVSYDYINYKANMDMLTEADGRLSKSTVGSSEYGGRMEMISPLSNGSFSPPGTNKFTASFGSMSERGSLFGFDSSVNQLFGSADGSNGQKDQNNGFFGFDFGSKPNQSFNLF